MTHGFNGLLKALVQSMLQEGMKSLSVYLLLLYFISLWLHKSEKYQV